MRAVPEFLSAESEHTLDWFHLTMRLTVMRQLAKSLPWNSSDKPEQPEEEETEHIEPTVAAEETVSTRERAGLSSTRAREMALVARQRGPGFGGDGEHCLRRRSGLEWERWCAQIASGCEGVCDVCRG